MFLYLAAISKGSPTSSSSRKIVKSNETYVAPPNPNLTEPDDEEVTEATPTKSSPTEVWLDRKARLVDCFNESVNRDKLEQADIIGVSDGVG